MISIVKLGLMIIMTFLADYLLDFLTSVQQLLNFSAHTTCLTDAIFPVGFPQTVFVLQIVFVLQVVFVFVVYI